MTGTFTKYVLATFAVKAIELLFGIGISVIIARALGPEGKGIYSLALLLPAFLVYFTYIGIGQASTYYLGKRTYPPKEIFGNNIIYTAFSGIVALLIGLSIIFFFSNELFPGVENKYLLIALLSVPLQLFLGSVGYILLGLYKVTKWNLIYLFRIFLLLTSVITLVVVFNFGIEGALIAEILAYLIPSVALYYIVKKETNGISLKLNRSYFKGSFEYGGKIYVGNLLSFLNYRAGLWLIGVMLNPLQVGFYSISIGFTEKLYLIPDAVGTVLFPKVSLETESNIKDFTPVVYRNILFICLLLAILLFIFSYWIVVLLYTSAFSESIQPLQILLIGTVAATGWKVLESDLKGRGKPMITTYIAGIAAIANIVLSILLIPRFGIAGAAWAVSVSYTIAAVSILIMYLNISGNSLTNMLFIKKSDLKLYANIVNVFLKKRGQA